MPARQISPQITSTPTSRQSLRMQPDCESIVDARPVCSDIAGSGERTAPFRISRKRRLKCRHPCRKLISRSISRQAGRELRIQIDGRSSSGARREHDSSKVSRPASRQKDVRQRDAGPGAALRVGQGARQSPAAAPASCSGARELDADQTAAFQAFAVLPRRLSLRASIIDTASDDVSGNIAGGEAAMQGGPAEKPFCRPAINA